MFHIMVLKGRFLYVICKSTCPKGVTQMIRLENGLEGKKIVYNRLINRKMCSYTNGSSNSACHRWVCRMTQVTLLDGFVVIQDHQGKLGHCDQYKKKFNSMCHIF